MTVTAINVCKRGSYCMLGATVPDGQQPPSWEPFTLVQVIDSEGIQNDATVRRTVAVLEVATGRVLFIPRGTAVMIVEVKFTCTFTIGEE